MKAIGRLMGLFAWGVAVLGGNAQNVEPKAGVPPPTASTGMERTLQELTQPASWLTWGGDVRLRSEFFDNIITLSQDNPLHQQDYFRFRARVWTSITPVTDLSLNARLATEPREWLRPAGYTPFRGRSGMDPTEGIVDNLNAQWRNILGQPLSMTVGRQDITLGEGWLTGDGTPLDGSWTYYLDAARLAYEIKDQHTTIGVIGIMQDAKDNGWLPPIHELYRFETEQNEKGAILNIVNTNYDFLNINPYFFYKHDDRVSAFNAQDLAPRGGDNADIYTLGGRLAGTFARHWKYYVEGAYQFGRKQDVDISDAAVQANGAATNDFRNLDAFGFNSKLAYAFNDALNNQVAFSYEFLSGDNPHSHSDEMFDVLWGRYPRWSEIGAFDYINESRYAQQANLHRFGPTWTISPWKKLDFTASYYALFAAESVPTREANAALFTGNGNFRGHFLQAILRYRFSQHVSGHLWSEMLFPGDFYTSRTTAYFLRAELLFSL